MKFLKKMANGENGKKNPKWMTKKKEEKTEGNSMKIRKEIKRKLKKNLTWNLIEGGS